MHIEFLPLTLEFNMKQLKDYWLTTFVLASLLIAAVCQAEVATPSATQVNQTAKQNLTIVKAKIAEFWRIISVNIVLLSTYAS